MGLDLSSKSGQRTEGLAESSAGQFPVDLGLRLTALQEGSSLLPLCGPLPRGVKGV